LSSSKKCGLPRGADGGCGESLGKSVLIVNVGACCDLGSGAAGGRMTIGGGAACLAGLFCCCVLSGSRKRTHGGKEWGPRRSGFTGKSCPSIECCSHSGPKGGISPSISGFGTVFLTKSPGARDNLMISSFGNGNDIETVNFEG
jgi:hypothetical protein